MRKKIAIAIVLLFLCISIAPSFNGSTVTDNQPKNNQVVEKTSPQKTVPVILYLFEKTGIKTYEILVSTEEAEEISTQFEELREAMTSQPLSEKTLVLQQEFINMLDEKGVIPQEVTKEQLVSLLKFPVAPSFRYQKWNLLPFQNRASEWFCTYVSFGSGAAFPIIILPRFIPFILTPIPRVFLRWNAKEGVTSCGGLASGTGFIAVGEQKGVALGFWGIGFTFSLPPLMNTYGMAGYALYATVSADYIEFYPPNNPPVITGVDPSDDQKNVPLSLSELRFRIEDGDSDLMSYTVTTEPDIGSGSGGLKPDGVYSIPVEGLESLTEYTWYLSVTDGKDTVGQTMTFITEPIAPILTNPSPADGERDVSLSLQELAFTVHDFQGDAMDYTVETSPDIGSASGTGIHNGTYSIPVSGLAVATTYHWYINITDGAHWTRKMFSFETGYPAQFNPFDYGWQYRKQITIDRTQVADDLANFAILLSTIDADLREHAQENGEDIMFMNDVGTSTRVYHDLESYDASSGDLVAWVNMPSLSSSNDTILYMYYGNPQCITQEYPEKTWDSHYQAVWHMNDATLSTISDSTINGYTGTKKAVYEPIAETAQIDNGQTFDGSDDYIQTSARITTTGVKSWSCWLSTPLETPPGSFVGVFGNCMIGSSEDKGIITCLGWPGPVIAFGIGNVEVYEHFLSVQIPVPDSNLHYYTAVYDGTDLKVYRDGSYVAMDNTKEGTEANPDHDFVMGRSNIYGGHYYLNGKLDEIRISNIDRNPSWISTEYNNQNNPADFLTFGPEEPGP